MRSSRLPFLRFRVVVSVRPAMVKKKIQVRDFDRRHTGIQHNEITYNVFVDGQTMKLLVARRLITAGLAGVTSARCLAQGVVRVR